MLGPSKGGIAMQDWLKSKSLLFSQIFVILFALLLLVLDLGCVPIVRWFASLRGMGDTSRRGFLAVLLLCSVFGWVLLFAMWRLLGNLRRALVFTEQNIRLLHAVSFCCTAAALICIVGCIFYLPYLLAAAAAGFMALIVRIVGNVFQKALDMKDELDLTI